jgi:hypothetical protein
LSHRSIDQKETINCLIVDWRTKLFWNQVIWLHHFLLFLNFRTI